MRGWCGTQWDENGTEPAKISPENQAVVDAIHARRYATAPELVEDLGISRYSLARRLVLLRKAGVLIRFSYLFETEPMWRLA